MEILKSRLKVQTILDNRNRLLYQSKDPTEYINQLKILDTIIYNESLPDIDESLQKEILLTNETANNLLMDSNDIIGGQINYMNSKAIDKFGSYDSDIPEFVKNLPI